MNIAWPQDTLRPLILHNHLFKNAGTSVDHILRQNFGNRWITREFDTNGPSNSQDVAKWITDNPTAVAFSTHTLLGPIPKIDGVRIIPIVMLRDPVDRIASAYRFERVQKADTRGTILARQNGFAGYVHARLNTLGDHQCRNFQTNRLAMLAPDTTRSELERAKDVAERLSQNGALGLVSDFAGAMDRLQQVVHPFFERFSWQPVTANASGPKGSHAVSPDMRQMLEQKNTDDYALLRHVSSLLGHQPGRTQNTYVNASAS